jgi:hypothetical protein
VTALGLASVGSAVAGQGTLRVSRMPVRSCARVPDRCLALLPCDAGNRVGPVKLSFRRESKPTLHGFFCGEHARARDAVQGRSLPPDKGPGLQLRAA